MGIIQISLSMSVLILFIAVLRVLFIYKISRNTIMLLWKLVMLRLLIPFPIPSVSFNFNGWNKNFDIASMAAKGLANKQILNSNMVYQVGDVSNKFSESVTQYINPFLWIWIIGFGISFIIFFKAYRKSYSFLRESLPIIDDITVSEWMGEQKLKRKVSVMVSDKITTPITFGIWKPKIVLPKNMNYQNQQQLKYVLSHEMVHIKKLDSFWKIISILVSCMHWFNPFVWLMYTFVNCDMEMACDEKVISIYGESEKSDYALTILYLAEQKSAYTILYNGFGKKPIKERVRAIMRYRKKSIFGISLSLAIILVTVLFLMLFPGNGKSLNRNEEAIKTVLEQIFTCPNQEMIEVYNNMFSRIQTSPLEENINNEIDKKLYEIYQPYISSKWYESFVMYFYSYLYVYSTTDGYEIAVDHIDIKRSDTIPTNYSFMVYLNYSKEGGEKNHTKIEGSAQFLEEKGKISYLQLFDKNLKLELMSSRN